MKNNDGKGLYDIGEVSQLGCGCKIDANGQPSCKSRSQLLFIMIIVRGYYACNKVFSVAY